MMPVKIIPHKALVGAGASVATVALLIALKLFAYIDSGSASVLASLIDSIVDAKVSVVMFLAIRFSLEPADEDHRFGHGKIEGVAAILQAAFIAGAGFFLALEAINRFHMGHSPHLHEQSTATIAIMIVSVVLSAGLVLVQRQSLRYAPSLALEADQAHYSTDIIINLGVIGVLLGLNAGAPAWIDPVFAILVVFYLAYTVKSIAGKGLDMLLDRELPEAVREKIKGLVQAHPDVMGMHDLRTRLSGMHVFISFDMEIAPELTLREAHDIARAVEHRLLAAFPNADILIHIDPCGDTDDSRHRVAGVHHG